MSVRTNVWAVLTAGIMAIGGSSAALAADEVTLDFATALPEGGSEARAMNHFKEVIEDKTNGDIEVNLFLGGVLGNEKSVFEQLNVGEVHMNLGGELVVTTYAPEYYIFGVPFLFPNREAVGEMVDGELGEQMADAVAERSNIMVAGYSLRMGRQLITKDRRVLRPEDVQGLKIRLPNISSWQIAWKQLGAIPTPIPTVETFQALQSGIVEAAENPVSPIYAFRQHEVTKYISLTNHLFSFRTWSVSQPFFDSLSEEHQQALMDAVAESTAFLNEIEEEVDRDLLVRAQEEEAWEVLVPDRAAFKEAVLPSLDEIRKDWVSGLYEEYVQQYIEAAS